MQINFVDIRQEMEMCFGLFNCDRQLSSLGDLVETGFTFAKSVRNIPSMNVHCMKFG
jgi:hypothetical protein